MTLILGVDPGSRKTGFGIVNAVGGKLEYVRAGFVRNYSAALGLWR